MNSADNDKHRDVFIYFSYKPEKTRHRIERFVQSLKNYVPNTDFQIVTFDEIGDAGARLVRLGDMILPQNVYNLTSVRALDYPAKVPAASFPFKLHCDIPILLFWRDHPEYRRYWVIEDDVEYTGQLGRLIDQLGRKSGDAQLLCTHLRLLPKDWDYIYLFATGGDALPQDHRLRVCFLPFFCATAAALAAIDAAYRRGWNGQHEMVWPNVLDFVGMPIRDIGGRGPFVAPEDHGQCYIDNSPDDYQKLGSFGTLRNRLRPGRQPDVLWHPVKTFPNWVIMKRRRMLSVSNYYCARVLSALAGDGISRR